jgi:hypothetical protein
MSGAHKNRATEIISVAKKGATALSAFASDFEVVNEIISPTKSAAVGGIGMNWNGEHGLN